MCGKELARIVQSQAFRQGAFAPIECHNQRAEDYKLARPSIDVLGMGDGCTLLRSLGSPMGIPTRGGHRERDALLFPRRRLEFYEEFSGSQAAVPTRRCSEKLLPRP
jgi:hypothetical protein